MATEADATARVFAELTLEELSTFPPLRRQHVLCSFGSHPETGRECLPLSAPTPASTPAPASAPAQATAPAGGAGVGPPAHPQAQAQAQSPLYAPASPAVSMVGSDAGAAAAAAAAEAVPWARCDFVVRVTSGCLSSRWVHIRPGDEYDGVMMSLVQNLAYETFRGVPAGSGQTTPGAYVSAQLRRRYGAGPLLDLLQAPDRSWFLRRCCENNLYIPGKVAPGKRMPNIHAFQHLLRTSLLSVLSRERVTEHMGSCFQCTEDLQDPVRRMRFWEGACVVVPLLAKGSGDVGFGSRLQEIRDLQLTGLNLEIIPRDLLDDLVAHHTLVLELYDVVGDHTSVLEFVGLGLIDDGSGHMTGVNNLPPRVQRQLQRRDVRRVRERSSRRSSGASSAASNVAGAAAGDAGDVGDVGEPASGKVCPFCNKRKTRLAQHLNAPRTACHKACAVLGISCPTCKRVFCDTKALDHHLSQRRECTTCNKFRCREHLVRIRNTKDFRCAKQPCLQPA